MECLDDFAGSTSEPGNFKKITSRRLQEWAAEVKICDPQEFCGLILERLAFSEKISNRNAEQVYGNDFGGRHAFRIIPLSEAQSYFTI